MKKFLLTAGFLAVVVSGSDVYGAKWRQKASSMGLAHAYDEYVAASGVRSLMGEDRFNNLITYVAARSGRTESGRTEESPHTSRSDPAMTESKAGDGEAKGAYNAMEEQHRRLELYASRVVGSKSFPTPAAPSSRRGEGPVEAGSVATARGQDFEVREAARERAEHSATRPFVVEADGHLPSASDLSGSERASESVTVSYKGREYVLSRNDANLVETYTDLQAQTRSLSEQLEKHQNTYSKALDYERTHSTVTEAFRMSKQTLEDKIGDLKAQIEGNMESLKQTGGKVRGILGFAPLMTQTNIFAGIVGRSLRFLDVFQGKWRAISSGIVTKEKLRNHWESSDLNRFMSQEDMFEFISDLHYVSGYFVKDESGVSGFAKAVQEKAARNLFASGSLRESGRGQILLRLFKEHYNRNNPLALFIKLSEAGFTDSVLDEPSSELEAIFNFAKAISGSLEAFNSYGVDFNLVTAAYSDVLDTIRQKADAMEKEDAERRAAELAAAEEKARRTAELQAEIAALEVEGTDSEPLGSGDASVSTEVEGDDFDFGLDDGPIESTLAADVEDADDGEANAKGSEEEGGEASEARPATDWVEKSKGDAKSIGTTLAGYARNYLSVLDSENYAAGMDGRIRAFILSLSELKNSEDTNEIQRVLESCSTVLGSLSQSADNIELRLKQRMTPAVRKQLDTRLQGNRDSIKSINDLVRDLDDRIRELNSKAAAAKVVEDAAAAAKAVEDAAAAKVVEDAAAAAKAVEDTAGEAETGEAEISRLTLEINALNENLTRLTGSNNKQARKRVRDNIKRLEGKVKALKEGKVKALKEAQTKVDAAPPTGTPTRALRDAARSGNYGDLVKAVGSYTKRGAGDSDTSALESLGGPTLANAATREPEAAPREEPGAGEQGATLVSGHVPAITGGPDDESGEEEFDDTAERNNLGDASDVDNL